MQNNPYCESFGDGRSATLGRAVHTPSHLGAGDWCCVFQHVYAKSVAAGLLLPNESGVGQLLHFGKFLLGSLTPIFWR